MFEINRKWKLLLLGPVLALAGAGAWAATAHIAWVPDRLAPDSLAPSTSTSYTVALKNIGPKPLSEGPHLAVEIRGEIASYVTLNDLQVKSAVKADETIGVTLRVTVPPNTPLSVKRGELVLVKMLPNGKQKEEFSPSLPVELTFSSIPLPGDPGEEGKKDLLGIDRNQNGVRDDIERYIVLTYPDSAKKRMALEQSARGLHAYLRDHQDKAMTRENGKANDKANDCLVHVFNDNLEATFKADDELTALFLNTKARSRAYRKADVHMGGYVSDYGLSSNRLARQKAACMFNVDALPN